MIASLKEQLPANKACRFCKSKMGKRIIFDSPVQEKIKKYGSYFCRNCGNFHSWIKPPEIIFLYDDQKTAIDNLLIDYHQKLTKLEIDFLLSVRDQRFLTVKQKTCLNKISLKLAKTFIDKKIPAINSE